MSRCLPIAKLGICSLVLWLSGLAVQADEPATRDPLPNVAATKQAIAAVDMVFRREFARATTPRLKRDLALKLLQQGIACEHDAAARYALLMEAQRTAKAAGDLDLYMEAVGELSETFAVDRWRLKCDALAAWPKKSASERDHKLLATRISAWIDMAVAADQYAAAEELCVLLRRQRASRKTIRSSNGLRHVPRRSVGLPPSFRNRVPL